MNILKLNMTGPEVDLLQSILKRLGFYQGEPDGIFGERTKNAVINFQKSIGLAADGIVGPNTWKALKPYINGYILHTVVSGDTFFRIARQYNTTTHALIFSNPNLNYNNLMIGQTIIVPFGSVVPTDIRYTSDILNKNVDSLKTIYPFLNVSVIGTSTLGTAIPSISFGNGTKEVFYSASFHANEWITSVLLMKFLELLSKSYVNNSSIFGTDARTLFDEVKLYIVPMVNPDGVDLVTEKLDKDSYGYKNAQKISENFPDIPFPNGWKANIEGIDFKNYQPQFHILIFYRKFLLTVEFS